MPNDKTPAVMLCYAQEDKALAVMLSVAKHLVWTYGSSPVEFSSRHTDGLLLAT
jgi:hypothetical protein